MAQSISRSESIARAVADDLSKASSEWAFPLLCKFEPLPSLQLKDVPDKSVKLSVRDLSQRSLGLHTRAGTTHEYDVEVIGRIQLTGDDTLTLSRLKLLLEQIVDWFWIENARPTDCEENLDRIEDVSIGEDVDLQERRLGKLSLRLVFNGNRSRPS